MLLLRLEHGCRVGWWAHLPCDVASGIKHMWGTQLEQRAQGEALVALARVTATQAKALLLYGGRGGVFWDPLSGQEKLPILGIEWLNKGGDETDAQYLEHARTLAAGSTGAGVTNGRRQLGVRCVVSEQDGVIRVWQMEHAPLWWEEADVLQILADQSPLLSPTVTRRQWRGRDLCWWVKARAPLAVQIVNLRTMEEDGLEEREVWARIAPLGRGPTRQTQLVRAPGAWVPPQPKPRASTTAKDLAKGKPVTDEATIKENGRRANAQAGEVLNPRNAADQGSRI